MEKITKKQEKETLESFNSWAKTYDRNILLPIFFKRVQKTISKYIESNENKKVLDIGCGTGNFLISESLKNPNSQYFGSDISEKMISIAKNKSSQISNLEFKVGDLENLGFDDNSLDYVVSTFSFHHWQEQEKSLKKIHQLLKNQGKLIITDVNLFGGKGTNKIIRPKQMKKLLLQTGFNNVYQIHSTSSGKYGFLSALAGVSLIAADSAYNFYNSSASKEFSIPKAICATILITGGIIYSIPNWMSKISIGEK